MNSLDQGNGLFGFHVLFKTPLVLALAKSTIALSVCFIGCSYFRPLFGPVFEKVEKSRKSLSGATVEIKCEKYRKNDILVVRLCGGSYISFSSMFCTRNLTFWPVFTFCKKVKKGEKMVEKWSLGQIQDPPKNRIKSGQEQFLEEHQNQGPAQNAP